MFISLSYRGLTTVSIKITYHSNNFNWIPWSSHGMTI
ncbi:proline/betaine transporter [Rickettsia endosymbiont of Ixodes pacificus]|nr:proline/betaine transporter [Rickettsia endosymbiont of Ixodes pacificus]